MTERRHFEQGGAAYATHRPDYPEALFDLLAAASTRRRHALDVGCGTGQLARRLAERFERVTAADPSVSQIDNAVPVANVHYVVGTAERIDLDDGSVDLVVAAQAAHWFDLDAFYAEARRVAAPGAALALVTYGVPSFGGGCEAAFDAFYRGPLHAYWPPDRRHVEAGYRTLPFPFEEQSVPALHIERSWNWQDLDGYVGTWSATRRAIADGAERVVTDGLAALADAWGDPEIRRPVRWPLTVRLASPL